VQSPTNDTGDEGGRGRGGATSTTQPHQGPAQGLRHHSHRHRPVRAVCIHALAHSHQSAVPAPPFSFSIDWVPPGLLHLTPGEGCETPPMPHQQHRATGKPQDGSWRPNCPDDGNTSQPALTVLCCALTHRARTFPRGESNRAHGRSSFGAGLSRVRTLSNGGACPLIQSTGAGAHVYGGGRRATLPVHEGELPLKPSSVRFASIHLCKRPAPQTWPELRGEVHTR
jgi:hypothetical protein